MLEALWDRTGQGCKNIERAEEAGALVEHSTSVQPLCHLSKPQIIQHQFDHINNHPIKKVNPAIVSHIESYHATSSVKGTTEIGER